MHAKPSTPTRPRLVPRFVLLLALSPPLLAACAGFQDWQYLPTNKADERTIHVVSHGWHTGLVLSQQDLGDELAFLRDALPSRPYYEFGWGEADFYQAEKVTVGLALKALFWGNPTVMHVAAVPAPPRDYFSASEVVEIRVSTTGLGHLRRALRASFKFDPQGRPAPLKNGLYGESRFFAAEGAYHVANTCNRWTARLLKETGVPIDAVFTQRAGSVISQAQEAKQRYACCAQ